MLFISLLLSLYIMLYLSPAGRYLEDYTGVSAFLFFFIGGSIMAVFFFFVSDVTAEYLLRRLNPWSAEKYDSRRRIGASVIQKTRREKKLDRMNESQLDDYLRKHPDDALAMEIKCERLRQGGNVRAWAEAAEALLRMNTKMSMEEKCSRYNELADAYLHDLDDPLRAHVVLRLLIEDFPRSYQATLARTRIRMMEEDEAAL